MADTTWHSTMSGVKDNAAECAGMGARNQAVSVERIVIETGKLALTVALAPDTPHFMTSELARRLVRQAPSLPRHVCKNDVGSTFGAVIASTSIPHVLEHLIIDGQCASSSSDASVGERVAATGRNQPSLLPCTSCVPDDYVYVGTTEWIDEPAGKAHVEVNFTDDLEALRTLRDALDILNGLLKG